MQDSELIMAFLAESAETLDDVEPKLIDLQQTAESTGELDVEAINSIFRAFHSMKGSAGFLQFKNVSAVTHEAETLLDRFRKGIVRPGTDHVSALFRAMDVIRKLLDTVSATMMDNAHAEEVASVVEDLVRVIARGDEAVPEVGVPPPEPSSTVSEAQKADMLIEEDEEAAPAPAPPVSKPGTELVSPDMIAVYAQDAEELLEAAENALLRIEQSSAEEQGDVIRELLRALHTFKGNSGLLGMTHLEQLGHKLETLWQCVLDGVMPRGTQNVKVCLQIVDVFRKTVSSLSQGGTGKVAAFLGFSDLLDDLIPKEQREAPPTRKKASSTTPSSSSPPATPAPAPQAKSAPPSPPPGQSMPPDAKPSATTNATAGDSSNASGAGALVSRSVRVGVDKLDLLNNLVGELVIAEAMVTHNPDLQGLRLDRFERAAHQLGLITSEIQDISMSLRMIPLDVTLKKMVRLVHDLSAKASKKVELQLAGTETEVDRTVAELISDPLVHMVRNSVDHGIELPEERVKEGKRETGLLRIEAKHQAGEVLIIITDDGRGLNREKIYKKGLERGLVREGASCRDEEIYTLIFEPGFSTADKITDVSGRGVGMDVVRKNIERIRGRIEIQSLPGKGSCFTIHIPLTLAIIQGMSVRVGQERYIIPILAIRESLRPDSKALSTVVDRGEMVMIRGTLLPLFRLARLFRVQDAVKRAEEGIVVVVEDGKRTAALLVDELLGQQQTVVKSLGDVLGKMDGVAGASILADGRVGLILDVAGIVRLANDFTE